MDQTDLNQMRELSWLLSQINCISKLNKLNVHIKDQTILQYIQNEILHDIMIQISR